jgi:hypothetical protein
MARMVQVECEKNDGTKFVVQIDEQRYRLISSKVFLALKNTDPDYDGEIELRNFDTEDEAAVARSIAKAIMEETDRKS